MNLYKFYGANMQKIMILMLLLLLGSMGAKGQTCQWAEKIAGTGNEYGYGIAVDGSGNVYVTGSFSSSTLTFNNGKALSKSGGDDAYIAKYNTSGVCQWAEKISGTSWDETQGIAVDGSGNVYVTGWFSSSTLTFNNGKALSNSGSPNSGSPDAYIAKYNSSGVCQWAEKIAGTDYDSGYAIAVDGSGNVYVTGFCYSSTLIFNNGKILSNSGGNDAYIANYNTSGVCQWAEKIAGTSNDSGNDIAVDDSGNVYVTGFFASSTLTFNNSKTLSNSGGHDAYIAKYNSSGACQWAEKFAGTIDDSGYAIAVDGSGNVYVSGWFCSPTLTFNNGKTLSNSGYEDDTYIAKYNSSGVCQWAEKISCTSWDYGYAISVDGSGNVFVTGLFGLGSLTFNNGKTLSNNGRSNSDRYDAYIAKYNSSGVCQWAEKIAGTSDDGGYGIAVDGSGNVYVAGYFESSTLTFNNGKTLSNSGYSDAYIAKYTQNPDYVTTADGFSFTISPNPATTKVDLQINVTEITDATLTIYDLNGNEILTAYEGMLKQGGNSLQINCQALPNGVYNVILQTDSQKLTKRFVVSR